MEARLGVYEKMPYEKPGVVDDQAAILEAAGGYRQQDRMIRAKRQSLDRALHYSYQSAEISPVRDPAVRHRALINPNQVKQDYDDKIISVGYENNYKPGDVFTWYMRQGNTTVQSHWIIYLQDLTELAYFKGDARRCNYYVRWRNDKGEELGRWFAIRGPVETKINSTTASDISIDTPNHTLSILMTKDDETIEYFQRYAKFYVTGVDKITDKICWRVEATDLISMPGILQLTAKEYYANESEDANGIVGSLIVTPSEPEQSDIAGESIIKPKSAYYYTYTGKEEGKWKVDTKVPLTAETLEDGRLKIVWPKTYSGEFTLSFGSCIKTITVESLF